MAYLDMEEISKHKKMKANPFLDRLMIAFGTKMPDGTFMMDFDDFLFMFSVFNFYCSEEMKCEYYFRMMGNFAF